MIDIERKRESYLARAEDCEAKAEEYYRKADMREEVSGIPLGQPILVGHHSERRHRKALERADNAMRKAEEYRKKAKYYRDKAAGVGKGGISSDDPDAIAKLERKIEAAEASQAAMKAANKIIRAAHKAGVTPNGPGWDDFVTKLGTISNRFAAEAETLIAPDFAGRIGFPNYALTNNSANIRRMKKRVEQLKRAAEAETAEQEFDGFKVVENVEANRIQIIFPDKPDAEMRTVLKSRGFRWAPSQGAWQRHLNNAGRYAAQAFVRQFGGK